MAHVLGGRLGVLRTCFRFRRSRSSRSSRCSRCAPGFRACSRTRLRVPLTVLLLALAPGAALAAPAQADGNRPEHPAVPRTGPSVADESGTERPGIRREPDGTGWGRLPARSAGLGVGPQILRELSESLDGQRGRPGTGGGPEGPDARSREWAPPPAGVPDAGGRGGTRGAADPAAAAGTQDAAGAADAENAGDAGATDTRSSAPAALALAGLREAMERAAAEPPPLPGAGAPERPGPPLHRGEPGGGPGGGAAPDGPGPAAPGYAPAVLPPALGADLQPSSAAHPPPEPAPNRAAGATRERDEYGSLTPRETSTAPRGIAAAPGEALLPVLPLGTGITLVGLGLGFLGWRLRR